MFLLTYRPIAIEFLERCEHEFGDVRSVLLAGTPEDAQDITLQLLGIRGHRRLLLA
jgi:hypothetical protein